MRVTLDVSKLSGWLNADADCRVGRESRKRAATGGPGRRRASARRRRKQRAEAEDPSVEAAGRGTRGAHHKHVVHARDAGRVEAERPVERRRGLPSRKGKHKTSGDKAGRDAGGRGRGGGASSVQAENPTVEAAGRGTRGGHLKHVRHARDAGRVQAQRLVERRRVLPSQKEKHKKSGERRAGTREGVGAEAAQAGCRQRTQLWRRLAGARAERTRNI